MGCGPASAHWAMGLTVASSVRSSSLSSLGWHSRSRHVDPRRRRPRRLSKAKISSTSSAKSLATQLRKPENRLAILEVRDMAVVSRWSWELQHYRPKSRSWASIVSHLRQIWKLGLLPLLFAGRPCRSFVFCWSLPSFTPWCWQVCRPGSDQPRAGIDLQPNHPSCPVMPPVLSSDNRARGRSLDAERVGASTVDDAHTAARQLVAELKSAGADPWPRKRALRH